MAIPDELLKPIDEIKTPSNKILIMCLVIAVVSLFGINIILYRSGQEDKKDAIQEAKEQAKKSSMKSDYWEKMARIKDSLYDDCGGKRLEDARRSDNSVDKRGSLSDSIQKLINKIK